MSKMKVTLEWVKGPNMWGQIKVEVQVSRRNNYYIKHQGQIYVFENFKQDTKVVSQINGKWRPVGRVTFGDVFIGEPKDLSYEEWIRTPEGQEQVKKNLGEWSLLAH